MDVTANQTPDIPEIIKLQQKLDSVKIPPDLFEKATLMVKRASLAFKYGGQTSSFDQIANYIDVITSLPWFKRSEDILDIKHAGEILEKHHYGLHEIKDRILEYLSVMKLNKDKSNIMRAPILFFVGLVGSNIHGLIISVFKKENIKIFFLADHIFLHVGADVPEEDGFWHLPQKA